MTRIFVGMAWLIIVATASFQGGVSHDTWLVVIGISLVIMLVADTRSKLDSREMG